MKDIVNEKDLATLIRVDQLIATIYDRYQAPPNWYRSPGFVTLSKIILEQQVSLASANAHFIKLSNYIEDFRPENILKLSDEEMRTSQISRQKAKYLRELSTAILTKSIDLDCLSVLDQDEVRQRLTRIKGIGNWTVDIYLMFSLQAKDIFPIGDIAIVNTIKELTPARTKEQIMAWAEKWRPLRSLATYFLWHYYLEKRKNKQSANADSQMANADSPSGTIAVPLL